MATHSSTLAWKISWTGEHCRLRKESNMTERLHYYALSDFPGGSDGNVSAYNCKRPGFNPWVGISFFLEKEMAAHSTILVPWMEEPGGLQSMGPQRISVTE